MDKNKHKKQTSLIKWIWSSFWKTAVIPLIVVELAFIIIYFTANNWSQSRTVEYLNLEANQQLAEVAISEAKGIQNQLISINHDTRYFQLEVEDAYQENAELSPELQARMEMSDYGAYYTVQDTQEGGAAVFYSGVVPVGAVEKTKLGQLMVIEEDMIDLIKAEPLITSLYFNTYDSLNIIYPYFDVISQYMVKMDIPTFNFYYEADLEHNPDRGVEWTDVYLDPAGHGWMASAIAPVYSGDFLEGVVGIDVTVFTIANSILQLDVPYSGYAALVGNDGTILALPQAGEEDWGLKEITDHTYNEAILEDTFKPEEFNLYYQIKNANTLAQIQNNTTGVLNTNLHGHEHTIAWSTVEETGWKLVLFIEPSLITAQVNTIKDELFRIGLWMIGGLFVFYGLFFFMLATRARKMSENISKPLSELNKMVAEIGQGNYQVSVPNQNVIEFYDTAQQLSQMGQKLGETTKALSESELRYNLALEGAEAGLWDYDIQKNEVYMSPLFKQILGYQDHELESSVNAWYTLLHQDDIFAITAKMNQIREGNLDHIEAQVRMKHKNGDWIWVSTRGGVIQDDAGHPSRIVGTNTDITNIMQERLRNSMLQEDLERKESHLEELKEVTLRDALTGVYNRRYFETLVSEDVTRAHQLHKPLTMAIIDLDHFKRVNDTWGHDIGDEQLNLTAQLIKQNIRESDAIIRLGGEEFVIIFKDTDLEGAMAASEKIREAIDHNLHPITGHQSISIGLAQLHAEESKQACLKRADEAMYLAKQKGRNRIESL